MLIANAVVVQIVMSRSIFLCSDGVSTWTKFDDHIYLLYKKSPLYNVLWECIGFVYT